MARRSKSSDRPAVPGDDSLELQSRGVGNEGGNMGVTTEGGANADADKSPLANDAGMEAMAEATRRASGTKSGKAGAGGRGRTSAAKNDPPEKEASRAAQAVGRMTRKGAGGGKAKPPVGRGQRSAPKTLADKMKSYGGAMTGDRESRRNGDQLDRGTGSRAAPADPNHETSGSRGGASGARDNYLKVDQGAGGASGAKD